MKQSKDNLFAVWALAVVLSGAVRAGEDRPPTPQPPTPENPNSVLPEKPAAATSLDQDWVIDDSGRRDPFTFVKNVVVVEGNQGNQPETPDTKAPDVPPEVLQKIKNDAEMACNMAEAALMDLDPA